MEEYSLFSVWKRLVSDQPDTDLGTELEGAAVTVKGSRNTFGKYTSEVNSFLRRGHRDGLKPWVALSRCVCIVCWDHHAQHDVRYQVRLCKRSPQPCTDVTSTFPLAQGSG